jgi:AraC-like DNA-binding protein
MVLKEFSPSPATRGTIRAYRVVHFMRAPASAPAVKVYPATPEQSLQLFVHDREIVEYPDGRRVQWNCVLAGAHDVTVRRIVPPRFLMIQAVFQPGALYRLIGIPGIELLNAYRDAESVWGTSVRRLRQSLGEARDYRAMIALVDDFIAGHEAARGAAHRVEPLLRKLRDRPGIAIEAVARQCALSLRQLERHCVQHTGLAPRELASVARFDRAFHTKLQRPDLDWLSIAIACGYFDYQHMTRDFRLYAGHTPPRLLETQRTSPEHLLGVPHEFELSYGRADR